MRSECEITPTVATLRQLREGQREGFARVATDSDAIAAVQSFGQEDACCASRLASTRLAFAGFMYSTNGEVRRHELSASFNLRSHDVITNRTI
jgi:hypothetical protein